MELPVFVIALIVVIVLLVAAFCGLFAGVLDRRNGATLGEAVQRGFRVFERVLPLVCALVGVLANLS
ncbi:hypothetical protein [Nocardia salmonicida]|uniref:hypothetical protein n=1 Tax=Nocardia salmonicida TaxID=53431 RepID=UPI00378EAFBD